jgi:hypothetical protein
MTLEAAFNELLVKWRHLAEELEQGLLWSVIETKPPEEHALANHYVDGATDLVAAAREGVAACQAAADGGPGPAARALLRCQQQYNAVVEQFHERLASYGRLRRLRRFGREKGGAWKDWAVHVRQAVGRCRRPMEGLGRMLFGCWQEVIDRLATAGVSVQATNIGQQITMPAESGTRVEAMT